MNSFTSLSLDPPLVLFCAGLSSTTWPHIRSAGRFLVQMLAADQHDVARVFARSGGDKFGGLAWHWRDRLPELDGIAAALSCSMDGVYAGGDHEIAVGRVEAVETFDRRPLVFHDGDLHALPLARAS